MMHIMIIHGDTGTHLTMFWVISILVDLLIERQRSLRDMSWHALDILVIIAAIWAVISFQMYHSVSQSIHICHLR